MRRTTFRAPGRAVLARAWCAQRLVQNGPVPGLAGRGRGLVSRRGRAISGKPRGC